MDPLTQSLIAGGLGAAGGILGGGGGDKFMSQKDLWGRHLLPDIKNIQQGILDLPVSEYFPGQTVADLDPAMIDAYNQMTNFGSGLGGRIAGGQLGQGMAGLGNLIGGTNYLQSLLGGGPQFGFDQGTYEQTLGNLLPTLQGTYADLTRDITRDLNWNQLPGLNQQAAASGNMASSRAGVTEGIMQGMAQDRMADIGSQLTRDAVGQAQQAGMTGGRLNLGADLSTQGNVLQGFSQMANLGLPGMANAYNTLKSNIGLGLQGGQGFRDYNQQLINEQIDRFNFNQQAPWDYYANQLNLLGGTTPAGMGINPQQANTPSPFQLGLQGGMAGIGLWNALQPTPSTMPGPTTAGFSTPAGGFGYDPFGYNPFGAAGFGTVGGR